ncbi:MAG: 4Fe-4S cluster-binding domain-containing protein [Bacilli bacterium]|nr:4Fe-4S cluster-binding domain-containing protein [Bacilli bacterium]MBQ8534762.1 4Fe-4S cluster-binding domain-containing protein [Bacilli bacterium]
MEILKNCCLCPRKCGINRYEQKGYCGANNKLKIAHYSLHMWEEPVISGNTGSGTIFFSNCNMKCMYCQNKKISLDGYGKYTSLKRLEEIMMELQDKGANNINLVTPTHYVPQIAKVLKRIKNKSLNIPVVYNTSSYENVGTLMMMNNLVDIYLADLKYYDDELALKYSFCTDYFETATMAIDEMYRQVGGLQVSEDGLLKKGVIVRVLILPGHIEDAKNIINYLYKTFGDSIIISIMNQFTPVNKCKYDNLNRKVTDDEYNEVIDFAAELGIVNAFVQEGDAAEESFIPDFDKNNI